MRFESIQTMYFRPHSSFPSATCLMFLIMSWFPIEGVLLPPKDSSFRPSKWRKIPDVHWKFTIWILTWRIIISVLSRSFLAPLCEMQLLYLKLCHNSCLKYSLQLNRSTGEKKACPPSKFCMLPFQDCTWPTIRISTGARNFSRHQNGQTSCGFHPA